MYSNCSFQNAVFTWSRFFLTANVFQGTLCLAFNLVGMHSAAASIWVLTKFLYLSFRESALDISWRELDLFLSIIV